MDINLTKSEIENLKKENPSCYSLLIMLIQYMNEKIKFKITGIIREPQLKSTHLPGYDYIYGYEFTDKNERRYNLKKEEAFRLVSSLAVENVKMNKNQDGLESTSNVFDLRKLKGVIPQEMNSYLSEFEIDSIMKQLDEIK